MLAVPLQTMSKLMRAESVETPVKAAPGWPMGIVLILAVLILLLVWGWSLGSDARILARMAPTDRARLFQLTRSKAEALCAAPDLEDRCRAEIDLLSKFPECGAGCQGFVASHRSRASR
jgi:hypothetical protein